jgi:D-sedoheptulose 7-phosphate isomerase
MRVIQAIQESIDLKKMILEDSVLLNEIEKIVTFIIESLSSKGKIHLCGNGGSAADAQHLAAELSGRFYYDRPPLNAEALHCNSSYLTAVANDYGYDFVYSRLIEASANKGDVLIAFSTSGNSINILNAIHQAAKQGVVTIGFTGASGGKMADCCNLIIKVPSTDTPRIQEIHILLGHIICELVEQKMFPKKTT